LKDLLNEFSHLEQLCNDIYGEKHGVTLYIEDMERTSSSISSTIPNWHYDLANLRRIRHIRNIITHENVNEPYSQEDVEFLKGFYRRIMQQQDPISMRRAQLQRAPHRAYNTTKTIDVISPNRDEEKIGFGKGLAVFIETILIAGVIIAAGWFAWQYLF